MPPVFIRPGWIGAWNEVKNCPPDTRQHLSYLSGHFPFGVHKYLGAGASYITLIRDPVGREISSYNFHYQRAFIDAQTSLKSMIENRDVIDNPQVRMIAGKSAMSGQCDEKTFDRAVKHLSKYFFILGVTEKSHEVFRTLISINRWPCVVYPRMQISGIKLIHEPSEELRRTLTEYHCYDVRLHQFASADWEARKKRIVADLDSSEVTDPVIYIPPEFRKTRKALLVHPENIKLSEQSS